MSPCPLESEDNSHFKPQAEDILTDEDLLELFRVLKQMMKKKPSVEEVAKIYFCMAYAMGDNYYFYRAIHSNQLVFRDEIHAVTARVQLPSNCCSCQSSSRVLSVSYLTNSDPVTPTPSHSTLTTSTATTTAATTTTVSTTPPTPSTTPRETDYCYYYKNNNNHTNNTFSIRPYTTIKPNIPPFWSPPESNIYPKPIEVMLEPKQRGFYYQDGRIEREPALLQRYAEQGVLTQASLMRKRRKQMDDTDYSYELSTLPSLAKKSKIPHRNGEFTQRRDDIINRMRTIMIADLEQKVQKLPQDFNLAIEKISLPDDKTSQNLHNITNERAAELLTPALRILTHHSNMKPHLANGMNQNGIYYNDDYFRLYLAFAQFQAHFSYLFPNKVITSVEDFASESNITSSSEKDRERNANMKVYRAWVEPHLSETNWAAFRRNTMVGERIMQLTEVVGQGILFMTKELSGSKIHLTFTNNEWDEFIQGLSKGRWDETIDWSHAEEDGIRLEKTDGSLLVTDLRRKLATHLWFTEEGTLVPLQERKAARAKERLNQHP
ncbi:hypothetical protein K501DRAFT_216994 [Backusella circina FSU 941]|nr:hypothetical protein K501DRAFT_216994 [Backusella circina FSU 941]